MLDVSKLLRQLRLNHRSSGPPPIAAAVKAVVQGDRLEPLVDHPFDDLPNWLEEADAAAAKALAKNAVIDTLAGMGVTPGLMNPDEFGAYLPVEVKRWGEMIKQAGINPE